MPENIVPFTEEDVKKYLDNCIMFWRKEHDGSREDIKMAEYYVDAYQSVRASLFGETLAV